MGELSFARFQRLVEQILKLKAEEIRERFIVSAFIAHQMGAGGEKNFGDYLSSLGLSEKKVIKEKTIDNVKENTKRILGKLKAMGK